MAANAVAENETSMDTVKFRNLMRHQAGAVTIIAVGRTGNRTGLTATAMCSLTDSRRWCSSASIATPARTPPSGLPGASR